ncbi:hypothetical protein ACH429_03445 [Streptomyces pathocidini]|uniref:Uncharacterized protein n=1 Tax=Streptomyces pathocidini TaxID=1650571 RepID=A0ABW7UKJ2_9ACTN|nr:hypothetical protein [Streptomyces pathocidini]
MREQSITVAPIGFGIARIAVWGGREATGRFLPTPAYFMPRRVPSKAPDFGGLEARPAERTAVPANDVIDRLKFPLSLALPGYNSCSWFDNKENLTSVGLWTEDGSTAVSDAGGKVRQIGHQRLWDTVEELAEVFPGGIPLREDFGLTITSEGQRAWYQDPEGPSWPLPTQ